jgi:hypothetical protein
MQLQFKIVRWKINLRKAVIHPSHQANIQAGGKTVDVVFKQMFRGQDWDL